LTWQASAFINVQVTVPSSVAIIAVAVVAVDAICAVSMDARVREALIDIEFAIFALCSQGTLACVAYVLFLTNATILAWLRSTLI
jgi:hypothetical protein